MAEIMDMAGNSLQSAQPLTEEEYVLNGLACGTLKLAQDLDLLEETAQLYPDAVKQYSEALEQIARRMMTIAVMAKHGRHADES